jgi:hypothetical protein
MNSNDPWPGQGNTETQVRVLAAAWCALTLPNHSNNAAWRAAVKDHLLFTATHSNHDFSDNNKYPVNWYGYAASPIFALALWHIRLLKAYDYLGRGSFTTAERATLDRWFYGAGNYYVKWFSIANNMSSRIPGRLSFNFTTSQMQGFWYQNNMNFIPYNGGPYVSAAGYWHNRTGECIQASSMIANYFKFHGITPPSGGTQPSYGWFTIDEILLHSKVWYAEWLHFSVSPLGYIFDFHRGQQGGATHTHWGWGYGNSELTSPLAMAKHFARRGDDSLWSMSTTGGHNNTAGSPNNTSGVSGFPAKNIEFVVWSMARYVNDAWGRRLTWGGVTNGTIPPPNAHRDILIAAVTSKRFPGNALISSQWRRSGNGMPGYHPNPEAPGSWPPLTGVAGSSIGLIEVGGV